LGDEVDVQREEGGFQAHAGAGDSGLATGVPGSNDDHIELFGELHRPFVF
jgi:hypothetical protein